MMRQVAPLKAVRVKRKSPDAPVGPATVVVVWSSRGAGGDRRHAVVVMIVATSGRGVDDAPCGLTEGRETEVTRRARRTCRGLAVVVVWASRGAGGDRRYAVGVAIRGAIHLSDKEASILF